MINDDNVVEEVSMKLVDKVADYLKKHPKEDIVRSILRVLESYGVYDPNEIPESDVLNIVAENMPLDTNESLYDFIFTMVFWLVPEYDEEDEF